MSQGKSKTYEWYRDHYYNNYLRLKQYKDKLATGLITTDDLRDKASARALQAIQDDQMLAMANVVDADADLGADAEYRDQRMDEYEKAGDWDDAGDRALLISLVELETQHRAIRRDLSRAKNLNDKEKYWTALRQNSEAQKNLQVTLGIDKKSRETARATGNPMENWDSIKNEIGDWVDMLVEEFVSEASMATTEDALRDLIKMKLSWPLAIVDAVVYNVKRVNGYTQEIE